MYRDGQSTQDTATSARPVFATDRTGAVKPLCVDQAQQAGNVLSLQMPVQAKEANYTGYVFIFPGAWPVIKAFVAYARLQGSDKIMPITICRSIHMIVSWIANHDDSDFDAFIVLDADQCVRSRGGMFVNEAPAWLDRIQVPAC